MDQKIVLVVSKVDVSVTKELPKGVHSAVWKNIVSTVSFINKLKYYMILIIKPMKLHFNGETLREKLMHSGNTRLINCPFSLFCFLFGRCYNLFTSSMRLSAVCQFTSRVKYFNGLLIESYIHSTFPI